MRKAFFFIPSSYLVFLARARVICLSVVVIIHINESQVIFWGVGFTEREGKRGFFGGWGAGWFCFVLFL